MESYKKLLLANRAWAHEKRELKPGFFNILSQGQKPEFLWIGCSDSRVPAEEVTGAQPGEIFVHRNIANMVIHADFNLMSVLQYAVTHLKVKHIIVCGHYGCGGVQAAMSNKSFGMLDRWLHYIKDCYMQHRPELEAMSEEERWEKMVEFNVEKQIRHLSQISLIQKTWKTEGRPLLHGWVFGLKDGLLRDVTLAGPDTPVESVERFDFEQM